jgi:epsilon-lactone hydrolase
MGRPPERGQGSARVSRRFAAGLAAVASMACAQNISPLRPTVDSDAIVHLPGFSIPFSSLLSAQAKESFVDRASHPLPWHEDDIPRTRREIYEQFHKPLLDRLNRLFAVTITPAIIGGVQTDVVRPKEGVAYQNRSRVLINLHGGGFEVGAHYGGQIESIPIAALGRIEVVTVDYREGPENRFPAASEDVAAVYGALLKNHNAHDIGIYGCSAGGILTAEALAWFQQHHLPRPGAAGIFGAGASAESLGDSIYIGTLLSGAVLDADAASRPPVAYFGSADTRDPLVSPLRSPSILAKFPPVMIITSTRDPELSSAVYTHTQLVKAGVDADLHVWEGAAHCFFYWPDPPESNEAWRVIVDFFSRHLGEANVNAHRLVAR